MPHTFPDFQKACPVGQAFRLLPAAPLYGPSASRAIQTQMALPLAGSETCAFTGVTLCWKPVSAPVALPNRATEALVIVNEWGQRQPDWVQESIAVQLLALSRPRAPFAGLVLPLGRPLVMGIVNVTPDSFSDGGDFATPDQAIAHGVHLLEEGADLLDIGGESTRPGAPELSPNEEISRILPVIRDLAGRGAVLSVDTRHSATMAAALEAGARIINDITALEGDSNSLKVVREARAPVILMHMQNTPETMQANPHYADAPLEIALWLEDRVQACVTAGLDVSDICIDPGLGFGKTTAHNLDIMAQAGLLLGSGTAVLIAGSRKRFLGDVAGEQDPKKRLGGSLALALKAARSGAHMVRVHDVADTRQALAVAHAMDAV